MIAILLILKHNMVKSWQLLQTEFWILNLWLKKKKSSRQSILYCYYFSHDHFFCLNQFYHNKKFVKRIYQNQKTNLHKFKKDCHQDNLSFACLQFYKHNYLNIVAGINLLS